MTTSPEYRNLKVVMAAGKQALWDTGHDETVEINQRALIDKVLARYSGEFTVFRELLQNSDDARATSVEIRFQTKTFLDQKPPENNNELGGEGLVEKMPNLRTKEVHQWSFRNNGTDFRDEDWSRLKKIAEGNPDEKKIGAFGVGFYSLFSVTEEPFVTSGDQWMGFYWKDGKDQLFARRGKLPDSQLNAWTTFDMRLREPCPMPVAFDFTRFLASSITFMTYLQQISVYFDDKKLAKISKSSSPSVQLEIPRTLTNVSPLKIMRVAGITTTPLHINSEVLRCVYDCGTAKPKPRLEAKPMKAGNQGGFLSSLFSSFARTTANQQVATPLPPTPVEHRNPLAVCESNVALSVFSADINVTVDRKLSSELQRSTKKDPPTKMKYELIYIAKAEYDASKEEDKCQKFATGSVFQGLRADLDGTGAARVFIGHATAQTTGLGGHMAARFIPTVERESIDFMDRNVAIWNKELLYIGGFLARAAYEFELNSIGNAWKMPDTDVNTQQLLIARALHALKFFSFHQSTPSPEVSTQLEAAFFSCSSADRFPLISTRGVFNSSEVRLPDPELATFLKRLPVLPENFRDDAQIMISSLQTHNLIKEITFDDVLKELQARPLSEGEMTSCLKWWIGVYKQGDTSGSMSFRSDLINAAVLDTGKEDGSDKQVIPLSSVKTYINPGMPGGIVPLDGPIPTHVLPIAISKAISVDTIAMAFPWTELLLIEWLTHVCSPAVTKENTEFDLNISGSWTEHILTHLARAWPEIPPHSKEAVVILMKDKTCIPTSHGMRQPEDAYFASVNIFNDLPVVALPSGTVVKGAVEQVLGALGVRKHVDLQIIFNKMIKTDEWTITELVNYLVSVKSTLTADEMKEFEATSAFPSEVNADGAPARKPNRFKAGELYEPLDVFRQLGLPVIDWGKQVKWRSSSEEAKLLYQLGLRRHPPLDVLIGLCACPDEGIRSAAMKFLLDNISTKYQEYDPTAFKDIKYIPALRGSYGCLGSPQEVYANSEWMAFGFLVISPNMRAHVAKLKVKEHPPSSRLVALLETKPPVDESQAKTWFTILLTRVNDFQAAELNRLSKAEMVPVRRSEGDVGPSIRWLPPSQCYLAGQARDRFHSKLFVFIDFGTAGNAFLTACGTRHEPGVEEVAKILLLDPRRFYELSRGPMQFLAELRNIAVNHRLLSEGTLRMMQNSAVLLGSKRNNTSDNEINKDDNLLYDLKKPDQIVIVDDIQAYQAFGDSLFTAPQEDILECFYSQLGSKRLSSIVKEEYQTTAEISNSKITSDTRALVLERLPLFLHEHTHAATRVPYSWLSSGNNFIVKTFGKISLTKWLNFGEVRVSREQDASAVAKRVGNGAVQLWLSENSQVDTYEVATSLNRILFQSPKTNDALLFMTILSTDLNVLKRRGYNVDRILRQQKAGREAMAALKNKQQVDLLSPPTLPPKPLNHNPLPSSNAISKEKDQPDIPGSFPSWPTFSSSAINIFQNVRRKIGNYFVPPDANNKPSQPHEHSTHQPPSPTARSPGPVIAPLSNISSNIELAIRACKPESGNLLRNREKMQQVKESLDEGYCDVSGRAGNLNLIGEMGSVKVYLSQETANEDAQQFMEKKRDSLARFICIISSLAELYTLPLHSLHVFSDLEGGLIAFNRNGSIFLNLRYYEAWHDSEVQSGKISTAFISWYFTFAHEIAHNLVHPHNSEHEFYFSAICEKYILGLGQLLGRAT